MNNPYLKTFMFYIAITILGFGGSYIASFFTGYSFVQQAVGFLTAGLASLTADIVSRKTLKQDGLYLYSFPPIVFRYPAWLLGLILIIGGAVIFNSGN